MPEPWAVLIPILLADLLNPVLFGAVIFALGTGRPYASAISLVAGHTMAYMAAGVVLAIGFEKLSQLLANPRPLDFVIESILGVTLIWLAYLVSRPSPKRADDAPASRGEFGLASAFGFGIVINFIGIPFAVPYFAALDQILKADVGWAGALWMLGVYNLLYALPFVGVIAVRGVLGDAAAPVLLWINEWIGRVADALMPFVLLLLGIALIADAGSYFLRGRALF